MEETVILKAIGVLNRTYMSQINKKLNDMEVNYSDSIYLMNVGNYPNITTEEISKNLAVDRAAVARSIKRLSIAGFVKIKENAIDKRKKNLILTVSGNKIYTEIKQYNLNWIDSVLGELNEEERKKYIEFSLRISENSKKIKL